MSSDMLDWPKEPIGARGIVGEVIGANFGGDETVVYVAVTNGTPVRKCEVTIVGLRGDDAQDEEDASAAVASDDEAAGSVWPEREGSPSIAGWTHGQGPLREAEVSPQERLFRSVNGALKSCIDAHGPVTLEWRGSAAKRITSQLIADGWSLEPEGNPE